MNVPEQADALESLLGRLNLKHHLPTFIDEELTFDLLHSMGIHLKPSLIDLGLSTAEADRLVNGLSDERIGRTVEQPVKVEEEEDDEDLVIEENAASDDDEGLQLEANDSAESDDDGGGIVLENNGDGDDDGDNSEEDNNLCIKVDDVDFNKTNPGVWTMSMNHFKQSSGFTSWNDYKKDKPMEEDTWLMRIQHTN